MVAVLLVLAAAAVAMVVLVGGSGALFSNLEEHGRAACHTRRKRLQGGAVVCVRGVDQFTIRA